jgi:hypothetical protein
MIPAEEVKQRIHRRNSPARIALSFLIFTLSADLQPCSAQSDSTITDSNQHPSLPSTVTTDGLIALKAAAHVITAPGRWEGTDWLTAGGIVGATALSYSLDNGAMDFMERNRSSFNDDATDIAVEYGSGAVAIGVPATLYLGGLLFKEPWLRETGLLAGTTMVVASATTTLGKIAVGRARPYAGFGRAKFRPFNSHEEFMSFPSGHTTAAFALSAVLSARIKNPWATAGLYGVATAAAMSRMYTRDHWLSDVVFTAAYTSAVARSVVSWFEDEEVSEVDAHPLHVVPTTNGVSVVWRL